MESGNKNLCVSPDLIGREEILKITTILLQPVTREQWEILANHFGSCAGNVYVDDGDLFNILDDQEHELHELFDNLEDEALKQNFDYEDKDGYVFYY